MKRFYVYIMSNEKRGAIYVGVTSNLIKRIYEHKNNMFKGFTSKYSLHRLVYFEIINFGNDAFNREKQLKSWNRAWKIRLIEKDNSEWKDLYQNIL